MGSLTNAQIHVVEPAEERAAQKSYWADHSATASVEAMMLDSQAAVIDKEERPEGHEQDPAGQQGVTGDDPTFNLQVLAMLGCVEGARILELGAGIGRFTGELAATARSVLAVDFMENLIEENRRANGHRRNVRWQVGDATELQLPPGCADVVFSNWLLMYLSDAEVAKLAGDALTWVVEGGTVFFRESCFRQSGDKARKNNPTHYRNPRDYFAIFDSVETRDADGRYAHFELVSCKCVDTYVRIKKNQNQICWKWQKVVTAEPIRGSFRAFLDTKQYKLNGILRYERIFGPGFVSTGGLDTTKEFVDMLALKPDERVLDVGCGIGGGDFYMAAKFGAFVHGVDLSVNMVTTALERTVASVNGQKVSFEIADITTCEMANESYDVVYSRDTILHIHDKPALFKRFMDVLKPGGRLLISDYCRAPGTPSDAFAEYIAQRGYDLHSVDGYGRMLADAGFVNVQAEDRTWQFEACLRKELETAKAGRDDFVRDFSAEDYDAIVSGWQDKLVRVGQGEQRWGLFLATKPV